MWFMSAALKLNLESKQLSRKSPLGEKRPRLRLVWENPKLTADSHKEKSEVKPDSSYGRVLYNYFRYYDPETGRYITSDPIGLLGGLNTYVYVGNNPLYWVDLLGLTREDIDQMTEFVQQTQPDLNVDPYIGTFPMPGDGYRAITNPITRNITLDNYFLKENLSPRDLRLLENRIIHESIHRTRPRRDSILRPFTHDDIYDEADYRQKYRNLQCTPYD